MIIHLLSSHREGNQVSHHATINLNLMFHCKLSNNLLNCTKTYKSCLLSIAFLDFFLDVSTVATYKLHKVLVDW